VVQVVELLLGCRLYVVMCVTFVVLNVTWNGLCVGQVMSDILSYSEGKIRQVVGRNTWSVVSTLLYTEGNINPFQSNFSATRILLSSYLF
jgi:hypothetical protein